MQRILEMKHIKEIRKALKIKQSDFSKKLGIDQSNFSNIENGKLIISRIPEIIEQSMVILEPELTKHIIKKELELKFFKDALEIHKERKIR